MEEVKEQKQEKETIVLNELRAKYGLSPIEGGDEPMTVISKGKEVSGGRMDRVQSGDAQTDERGVKNVNSETISSIDKLIVKMADMLSETMNKGVVRDSTVLALAELISARARL